MTLALGAPCPGGPGPASAGALQCARAQCLPERVPGALQCLPAWTRGSSLLVSRHLLLLSSRPPGGSGPTCGAQEPGPFARPPGESRGVRTARPGPSPGRTEPGGSRGPGRAALGQSTGRRPGSRTWSSARDPAPRAGAARGPRSTPCRSTRVGGPQKPRAPRGPPRPHLLGPRGREGHLLAAPERGGRRGPRGRGRPRPGRRRRAPAPRAHSP